MKWSMKWSNGNVLSRHTFFWPYMVSCGTLQSPLNIRWRWCTPLCHWLRDITLSSKSNPYLHHVGTQNRQWNILNEKRSNLKLICVFLLDLLQFESYTVADPWLESRGSVTARRVDLKKVSKKLDSRKLYM